MNYNLIADCLKLIESFEKNWSNNCYSDDIQGFVQWISDIKSNNISNQTVIDWEGKDNGRTAESVISTLIVQMNRYAKNYSKVAMQDSEFSTQDEFIYLINLQAFGEMSKMELIKRNIHDKQTGIQIIKRLLDREWISQSDSLEDKREKLISITDKGRFTLKNQMGKIRQATNIVSGDLTDIEKMELIRILKKLEHFHKPIFLEKASSKNVLDELTEKILTQKTKKHE